MRGSILTLPEKQSIKLHKSVVFTCLVSGYPAPRVEWKKEKKSIISTTDGGVNISQTKLNSTTIRSVVKIKAVARTDTGTYSCESSNALDFLKGTSELLVLGMITLS